MIFFSSVVHSTNDILPCLLRVTKFAAYYVMIVLDN
jgi:hypothetical protein